MIIKESSYSIVLAGKWNPAILTPAWLAANLFEGNPQVQIEFSLNFDIPSRYKIKNVTISPSVDRVILLSNDNSDESLTLLESVAIKLCATLGHTPLVAVGVNFGFIEKENKDLLLPLMNFSDSNDITDSGWSISNQSIKRSLSKGGYFTNLNISLDENSDFHFDFNYHYVTINATQVSDCLLGKVIDYKNQSITLLNELFNLEIQENG
jgi:hypothetical protein